MAGFLEGVDEALSGVHGRFQKHEGIGFFCWKFEVAVGLHFFPGGIPPAFEGGGVERSGGEGGGDLVGCGFAAEVGEDAADDGEGIGGAEFLEAGGICLALGEDVVRGDRGEGLGGVVGLHRVVFFRAEVDEDLTGDEVPLRDASEAPAFVGAEGSGREAGEFVGGLLGEFAAFDGLGEFVSHQTAFVPETGQCMQGEEKTGWRGFSPCGCGAGQRTLAGWLTRTNRCWW